MPLTPRPDLSSIDVPSGPDPDAATEFQVLTAESLGEVESSLDFAGVDLASVSDVLNLAEADSDLLALDIVSGAAELAGMVAEAEADTIIDELARAMAQDMVLENWEQDIPVE